MRARLTIRTLALVVMVVAAPVAAQSKRAIARYDARGRMVRAFNLTERASDGTCERFVYVGTVTRTEYDAEGRPAEFWIKERAGRAQSFNLLEAQFDAYDLKRVPGLLRNGARVRVEAFGCGAGAAVLDAWGINLIR